MAESKFGSDLGIPEIDREMRPPSARQLPGAEKSPHRPYNYWSKDEFVLNADPLLRVKNGPILSKVVGRLDVYGDNPSPENIDKYLEVLADMESDPTVNATPNFTHDFVRVRDELIKKKMEASGGKGFAPEFLKDPETVVALVYSQLTDLVDTNVLENISHGWETKIQVTLGGFMPVTLGDRRFEVTPVAKTPVELRDSKGVLLENTTLVEYLKRVVGAAEAVTLCAYFWKTCNSSKKVDGVTGLDIPNAGLDALGKMLDPDLKTNIGDNIGKCFEAYADLAKGNVKPGKGRNFFREQGVSKQDEKQAREWMKETYLAGFSKEDATLLESLALNLTYAWGYSSDASSTGTMSATERATWLDRVFKTDVWRNIKRHSGGPRSTVGSSAFPRQLLMPTPELFTVVEKVGGKDVYRTLDAKFKENKYKLRDMALLNMPEIDHRFKVFVLDAVSFFDDETTPPDAIKASYGGFHKIAEHAENAINPALVFSQIETGYPNGVDKVEKGFADAQVKKRATTATVEVFKGLHREAKDAHLFGLAGEIQITAKRVTGKII